VERVASHTKVERLFAARVGHVLVDHNTSSLESLRRKLFELTGHQVNAEGEVLNFGGFVSDIIDSDLGVWDTTAKARLDVRLVLAITVTNVCRGSSSTHTHM